MSLPVLVSWLQINSFSGRAILAALTRYGTAAAYHLVLAFARLVGRMGGFIVPPRPRLEGFRAIPHLPPEKPPARREARSVAVIPFRDKSRLPP